jgi:predicted transcriptional regulator
MVRRSRLEIYFAILEVIDREIDKPTRIMYKANLSWNSLQDHLTTLLNGEFIREEIVKNGTRYFITEKGKRSLYYHRKSIEGLITLRTQHPVNYSARAISPFPVTSTTEFVISS